MILLRTHGFDRRVSAVDHRHTLLDARVIFVLRLLRDPLFGCAFTALLRLVVCRAAVFDAFQEFSLLSYNPNPQELMVTSVGNRATTQSVHYLELMLTLDGEPARKPGLELGLHSDSHELRQQLLAQSLDAVAKQGREQIARIDVDRSAPLKRGSR